jgi:hypothetical protein
LRLTFERVKLAKRLLQDDQFKSSQLMMLTMKSKNTMDRLKNKWANATSALDVTHLSTKSL